LEASVSDSLEAGGEIWRYREIPHQIPRHEYVNVFRSVHIATSATSSVRAKSTIVHFSLFIEKNNFLLVPPPWIFHFSTFSGETERKKERNEKPQKMKRGSEQLLQTCHKKRFIFEFSSPTPPNALFRLMLPQFYTPPTTWEVASKVVEQVSELLACNQRFVNAADDSDDFCQRNTLAHYLVFMMGNKTVPCFQLS
jgi:hypothetical protein